MENPSIITVNPSNEAEPQLQAQDFINRAMEEEIKSKQQDNAITKFLRDAEIKREKEEVEKDSKSDQSSVSSTPAKKKDPLNDMKNREFHIEDWDFEFTNQDLVRYLPSQLLQIRSSALIKTPENLPPKSFYRLRNNNNNNNNNNNGRSRQNYNSRNFTDGTGSMGNFNLGKKHHNNDRGHNNRRGKGRYNKKNDVESWLEQFETGGPAGNADDFEKWKSRINNEERRKRGEFVPEQLETNEDSEGSAKNTIDSFFSSGGLNSIKSNQTSTQNKNSKFFSFFKPEEQQSNQDSINSNKDGVSKILSFLDKGEQSAPAESDNQAQSSEPQLSPQQSRSQFNFANMNNNAAAAQPTSSSQQTPQFPPGLNSSEQNQTPKESGAKDSFFMSLLQKNDNKPEPEAQLPKTVKSDISLQQPAPKPGLQKQNSFPAQPSQPQQQPQQPPQQQQAQPQQLQKDQRLQGFPPGFQIPPGFPPPPGFQNPQGLQRNQLPPGGFENNNEKMQQQNSLPPGFPNQGVALPPWLAGQQMGMPPPNFQQFQLPNGQFLPPPNGNLRPGLAPPHLRQQGGQPKQGQQQQQQPPQGVPNNGNFAPHLVYGRPNGQIPPPMFFQGKEGEQQQGRFPPGFFNGPPGLIPQQPNQGLQQPNQLQQGK